jgi:hypothetical protein
MMAKNKVKHTQGPWCVREEPHHKWKTCTQFIIDSEDRAFMFVAEVHKDKDDPHNIEEVRANARLVKTAPKLLSACKAYFKAKDADEHHHAMVFMEEAIAEAEEQEGE